MSKSAIFQLPQKKGLPSSSPDAAAGPEYRRMDSLKSLLVDIGSRCGERTLHFLNSSVNYLEVGHWIKSRGFHTTKRVSKRRELFDQIAQRADGKKVLYLEFGVAKGASMRYWSNLLGNPESSLHGFDSFEGLPEGWHLGDQRGAYSAGGRVPQIADPRVKIFKGLFQDTLPTYRLPEHETLIINIDCDLYSSTSFVLNVLEEHISPGSYIYFDEFSDSHNELKAFHEFIARTNKRFSLLGATRSYAQVSFECI
jgi:hypothetical protein